MGRGNSFMKRIIQPRKCAFCSTVFTPDERRPDGLYCSRTCGARAAAMAKKKAAQLQTTAGKGRASVFADPGIVRANRTKK